MKNKFHCILIGLFIFIISKHVHAGERNKIDIPILFYECILCIDAPNISNPAYAVLYAPSINNWADFEYKDKLLKLIKIDEYKQDKISFVSPDMFYAPEVRLMLLGVLDYPIYIDRYGYVQIGGSHYKLETKTLAKIDNLLK